VQTVSLIGRLRDRVGGKNLPAFDTLSHITYIRDLDRADIGLSVYIGSPKQSRIDFWVSRAPRDWLGQRCDPIQRKLSRIERRNDKKRYLPRRAPRHTKKKKMGAERE